MPASCAPTILPSSPVPASVVPTITTIAVGGEKTASTPRQQRPPCCKCLPGKGVQDAITNDPVSPVPTTASGTSPEPGEVATLTYPDGSSYQGQLLDGKRNGRGTLTLADGTLYQSDWRDDKRHGEGQEVFPDGSRFSGCYEDGFRSGLGVMTWPEGSRYSGQFARGRANGEGHLLRTDGSVYRGQFSEDCMCGDGCMQWKDGVEYKGQFYANRRRGVGKMKWKTGRWRSYDGDWRDGVQHGHGTLVDMHGHVFSGSFRCGKLLCWDDDAKSVNDDVVEVSFHVPEYWSNQDLALGFNDRKEVPEGFHEQIALLLERTFKGIRTRDRTGQVPAALRLVKCHRVENSAMWLRYLRAKSRVSLKRADGVRPVNELDGNPETGHVRTLDLLDPEYARHLDTAQVNEFYLWHGTTPEGAIGISTNGFRLSLAGSRAGTFFGKGCYFAECSSKCDEYAREGDSILAGVYALLLCRVTCGNMFRITHSDLSQIDQALKTGEYDSVLGDREASVGTYREFVIFDEELVYPEYVVLYERKYNSPRSC
eukprot:TRINITY_DN9897_c0_g1_i2.p1 TRINITY_DN9897_c0_g1~~TRINITY_DN9897_c0_g1_i2.p1  ORF type:complete len:539 (+),score=70.13 TRINITY_DN9897_c0_g1_i2:45-1661(+)